jgi:Cu/Ag efflux pump CusA
MFSWVIGSSLKFRFLVLGIGAALLVFGTQQLRKMPVDVFPEFSPPKVEIQTEGPGMPSRERNSSQKTRNAAAGLGQQQEV